MNYLLACYTDVGIKKKTNQDSLLIQRALVNEEQMVLAVVCDGMGGLAKGEVASATVVKAFAQWFREELPALLERNQLRTDLHKSWMSLLNSVHQKIYSYGKRNGIQLGTTATAMLFGQEDYYIAHIGDSRAYEIRSQVAQLTADQTLVAREVSRGKLTQEQAKVDKRRSVLLQCIGASEGIRPEFYTGKIQADAVYLLCSDGFRHELDEKEMMEAFQPKVLGDEGALEQRGREAAKKVMSRGEKDNISVILVRSWKN